MVARLELEFASASRGKLRCMADPGCGSQSFTRKQGKKFVCSGKSHVSQGREHLVLRSRLRRCPILGFVYGQTEFENQAGPGRGPSSGALESVSQPS